MQWPSGREPTTSAPALLSGGALGAVLLAWLVLTLFAPGLGSVIAVFGSPVFAFFVIVRLLSLGPAEGDAGRHGGVASRLSPDPALLELVAARSDGRCSRCSAPPPLRLKQILPVGRTSGNVERRFVALCDACAAHRSPGLVPPRQRETTKEGEATRDGKTTPRTGESAR
jgi:hypothetical protein